MLEKQLTTNHVQTTAKFAFFPSAVGGFSLLYDEKHASPKSALTEITGISTMMAEMMHKFKKEHDPGNLDGQSIVYDEDRLPIREYHFGEITAVVTPPTIVEIRTRSSPYPQQRVIHTSGIIMTNNGLQISCFFKKDFDGKWQCISGFHSDTAITISELIRNIGLSENYVTVLTAILEFHSAFHTVDTSLRVVMTGSTTPSRPPESGREKSHDHDMAL